MVLFNKNISVTSRIINNPTFSEFFDYVIRFFIYAFIMLYFLLSKDYASCSSTDFKSGMFAGAFLIAPLSGFFAVFWLEITNVEEETSI